MGRNKKLDTKRTCSLIALVMSSKSLQLIRKDDLTPKKSYNFTKSHRSDTRIVNVVDNFPVDLRAQSSVNLLDLVNSQPPLDTSVLPSSPDRQQYLTLTKDIVFFLLLPVLKAALLEHRNACPSFG